LRTIVTAFAVVDLAIATSRVLAELGASARQRAVVRTLVAVFTFFDFTVAAADEIGGSARIRALVVVDAVTVVALLVWTQMAVATGVVQALLGADAASCAVGIALVALLIVGIDFAITAFRGSDDLALVGATVGVVAVAVVAVLIRTALSIAASVILAVNSTGAVGLAVGIAFVAVLIFAVDLAVAALGVGLGLTAFAAAAVAVGNVAVVAGFAGTTVTVTTDVVLADLGAGVAGTTIGSAVVAFLVAVDFTVAAEFVWLQLTVARTAVTVAGVAVVAFFALFELVISTNGFTVCVSATIGFINRGVTIITAGDHHHRH
jgi:hypothetical protein